MKNLFLLLLMFLYASCGPEGLVSSGNGTQVQLAPIIGTDDPELIRLTREAQGIIQRHCMRCHSTHFGDYFNDVTKWVDSGGRVVAGQGNSNSRLIDRIAGCGEGNSNVDNGANMPDGAPQISGAECDKLREWINALGVLN